MMKLVFVLLNVICVHTLWSQDMLYDDRINITSHYYDLSETDTNFSYTFEETGDLFTVHINGSDSLELIHYFEFWDEDTLVDYMYCVKIDVKMLCEDCTEVHVSKMLDSKYRKWVKVSESKYLSRRWVSKIHSSGNPNRVVVPVLQVIQNGSFTTVQLSTNEYIRKEWKARIRKAKRGV